MILTTRHNVISYVWHKRSNALLIFKRNRYVDWFLRLRFPIFFSFFVVAAVKIKCLTGGGNAMAENFIRAWLLFG